MKARKLTTGNKQMANKLPLISYTNVKNTSRIVPNTTVVTMAFVNILYSERPLSRLFKIELTPINGITNANILKI